MMFKKGKVMFGSAALWQDPNPDSDLQFAIVAPDPVALEKAWKKISLHPLKLELVKNVAVISAQGLDFGSSDLTPKKS